MKLFLASAALVSAAAFAQAPTAPTTTPAPTAVAVTQQTGVLNDPNEVVCVREQEIGSRLRARRVCRTRAEWDAYREQTRQVTERVQNQSKQTFGQ